MRAGDSEEESPEKLAVDVLAKYQPAALRDAAKRYQYAWDASPEDETWAPFRSRGYLTSSELEALSRWKTRGRQVGNIRANSEAAVRVVTAAATEASKEVPDEPALSIAILTALHGIDIPTASTVMTVWDPARFAIIDIRAWRTLTRVIGNGLKPLESTNGNRRPFRLAEVALYLRIVREMARLASLSCRDIDKALWVLAND